MFGVTNGKLELAEGLKELIIRADGCGSRLICEGLLVQASSPIFKTRLDVLSTKAEWTV
jgi:hypothetical protein